MIKYNCSFNLFYQDIYLCFIYKAIEVIHFAWTSSSSESQITALEERVKKVIFENKSFLFGAHWALSLFSLNHNYLCRFLKSLGQHITWSSVKRRKFFVQRRKRCFFSAAEHSRCPDSVSEISLCTIFAYTG